MLRLVVAVALVLTVVVTSDNPPDASAAPEAEYATPPPEEVQSASAVNDTTTPPNETIPDYTATPGLEILQVLAQVTNEASIAHTYLESILRLQHAQYNMQAGKMLTMVLMRDAYEDRMEQNMGFLEIESSSDLGLDDYEDNDDAEHDGGPRGDSDRKNQMELMAYLSLFNGITIKTYQTVYQAGDAQREFYESRLTQYVAMAGIQLEPPMLAYLRTFSNFLKTMRLAYALQTVSTFRTWLEDTLDVGTAVTSGSEISDRVADIEEEGMIRNKMYAFSALKHMSVIEFQVFYIDLYLEFMIGHITGQGSLGLGGSFNQGSLGGSVNQIPETSSSLLEVEAQANPTQSQSIIPTLAYGANPSLYMKLYHYVFLYHTMMGAQAGLTSSYLEFQSFRMATDDIPENDEDGDRMLQFARLQFRQYAQNLASASQLEYMTAMIEIFYSFAAGAGGSFGSL